MQDYSYLKKYVLPAGSETNRNIKHNFFPINQSEIMEAEDKLGYIIPKELEEFYKEIGYGFMHNNDEYSLYKLLDPETIAAIEKREGIYKSDPDLEIYNEPGKMIFFQLNEGVYLRIDLNKTNGEHAIYYFDKKIADSLEDFLKQFDQDPTYFED